MTDQRQDPAERLERQFFFDPSFRKTTPPPEIGFAGRPRPYLRTEQAGGRWDKKGHTRTNCEVWKAYERLPDATVRECVKRNVPKSGFQFDRRLDRLARSLRAAFPRDGAGEWVEVVEVWYFLARPTDPSWTKETVMARFKAAHAEASGDRPGRRLTEVARDRGEGDAAKSLAAVSRYLKRRQFFVSARTMADWLNVSPATANRRLAALTAGGHIRVVQAGSPHVFDRSATVYDVSPLFALCDHQPRTARTLSGIQLLHGLTGGDPQSLTSLDDDLPLCLTPKRPEEMTDEDRAFAAALDECDDDDGPGVGVGGGG